MITYKIYGVHQRDEMINRLKEQLDTDVDVYYDDRPNGGNVLYTAKKAWSSPVQDGETHRCVFQDDVIVCDNFTKIAEIIVREKPNDIISFFPMSYANLSQNGEKELHLNPYTHNYLDAMGVMGCAIMMPIRYAKDIFWYVYDKKDDEMVVFDYAIKNKIKITTIIPSVVQHVGDVSLLNGTGLHGSNAKTQFFIQQQDELWNIK